MVKTHSPITSNNSTPFLRSPEQHPHNRHLSPEVISALLTNQFFFSKSVLSTTLENNAVMHYRTSHTRLKFTVFINNNILSAEQKQSATDSFKENFPPSSSGSVYTTPKRLTPSQQITPHQGRPESFTDENGLLYARLTDLGTVLIYAAQINGYQAQSTPPKVTGNKRISTGKLVLAEDEEKNAEGSFTLQDIEKRKQAKEEGEKRSKPQDKVMAADGKGFVTAADAAISADPNLTKRWEWLHLLAHSLVGNRGQEANNLVTGTFDANTNMIFVERMIPRLVENLGDKPVTVIVKAELEPGTHIAKKIYYKVKSGDDISLNFEFDTQNTVRPNILGAKVIEIIFDSVIETVKKKLISNNTKLSSIKSRSLFSEEDTSPKTSTWSETIQTTNAEPAISYL